jgi:hypothetical protein
MENAELNNHRQHMEGADDFDCDDNPVNAASGEHLDPQIAPPPRLPSPPSKENSPSSPLQEAEAVVVSSSSLPPSPPSSSSASELATQQEAAALPRILPMDEDDDDGAGRRADNDENVHRHPISTSHDGLPEILPLDGFAAAAAAAQHRPAQDVMPAFGQLMGNDVRPGLATPAYLRQPTLHYNKRRRRGHDYAQQPPPPSAAAAPAGTRTQRIA